MMDAVKIRVCSVVNTDVAELPLRTLLASDAPSVNGYSILLVPSSAHPLDQMNQTYEAERDKEFACPHLCQLSKGDQSKEVLATVNEVAAECFPLRPTGSLRRCLSRIV
jgi:hypothetical protein